MTGIAQDLSRRRMMAACGAAATLPFLPSPVRAASGGVGWPHLHSMARSWVAEGRAANMVFAMGKGEGGPDIVAAGHDTKGAARSSDGNSLYRIYSMTKPVTGMAAMILVAEGRLALDQPLAEILPEFAEMMVQKVYDGGIGPDDLEPAERPILIRNLLTHTAGLAYSAVQQGPVAEKMRDEGIVSGRISRVPIPQFDRGEPVKSLAEFASGLSRIPLVYQPGTRWSYSTGLDLMGRVIEVVAGQPFDGFLQERIFDPCGMESTFFRVPESELYRLTTNYGSNGEAMLPIDPRAASVYALEPPFPMGGSGLVSSPRDYDRFLHMVAGYGVLDGRRVMAEGAVRLGTSNLLPGPDVVQGTQLEGYGFGAGGRIGWAGGRRAYGWAGAASTVGFVDMKSGLRGGLYTQIMPSAFSLYEDFESAVKEDIALRDAQ